MKFLSRLLYVPRLVLKTFRLFASAEFRAKAVGYMERMRKEGVDIGDKQQRRAWIRRQRAELSQALPGAYSGRVAGRNEHCSCGSHNKYERCCGADELRKGG